jgi:hypothetical protein
MIQATTSMESMSFPVFQKTMSLKAALVGTCKIAKANTDPGSSVGQNNQRT